MRNHSTLARPEIIQELAKCVPEAHRVDLEDPDVFVLIEVFKVRLPPLCDGISGC